MYARRVRITYFGIKLLYNPCEIRSEVLGRASSGVRQYPYRVVVPEPHALRKMITNINNNNMGNNVGIYYYC